jgi:hypothetical protein
MAILNIEFWQKKGRGQDQKLWHATAFGHQQNFQLVHKKIKIGSLIIHQSWLAESASEAKR